MEKLAKEDSTEKTMPIDEKARPGLSDGPPIDNVIAALAWPEIYQNLSEEGYAVTERILLPQQCNELINCFADQARFRSQIDMEQRGYGKGIYKYFSYPLPALIKDLRSTVYSRLALCANDWQQALDLPVRYPLLHEEYLASCHENGQKRPTPLLLKYEPGDYNCLHQDLYGELCFPLQMAILLSEPGDHFIGGEFVLSEQRPRAQAKIEVVPLRQGQAVIFAVNRRPVKTSKGIRKVTLKHGVSKLRAGSRYTLGIIFHDAK
jgi:uncharacterized protein